jgi:hypothetical protein
MLMPFNRLNQFSLRALIALCTCLLQTIALPASAWAWGRLGHRVASRIAERHLSPAAKAAVAALLDEGESIADASHWADENRGRLPKTAPWHYVDVPLDEPKYDSRFSGDVSSKGCVVDKINEFRRVVKDETKTVEERRFALRFLIHCIEDLHMPLHVGDNKDKGGNLTQVRWFDRGSNMHRVCDSGIIEQADDTEDFWLADLAELDTAENRAAWMSGTVEDWATESLLDARAAYQVPGTDKRIKSRQKLGDEYQVKHLPVVRRRLYQAGLRLAWVLNQALADRKLGASGLLPGRMSLFSDQSENFEIAFEPLIGQLRDGVLLEELTCKSATGTQMRDPIRNFRAQRPITGHYFSILAKFHVRPVCIDMHTRLVPVG